MEPVNLLLGCTKAGKSCLQNLLTNKNMSIEVEDVFKGIQFKITTDLQGAPIGNNPYSETKIPMLSEDFCDFPGLNDTGAAEILAESSFHSYKHLIKYKTVRLILVISAETISTDNGSGFLKLCKDIVSFYSMNNEHLKGIHIILSKCDEGDSHKAHQYIEQRFSNETNVIIRGIITREIRISEFLKPQKNAGGYIFSNKNREEIIKQIDSVGFLESSILKLKGIEDQLYNSAKSLIQNNEERKANQSRQYLFSKQINENKEEVVKAEDVIFIDDDIEIEADNLIFSAPLIIVRKKESDGICKLRVIGNNHPSITFKSEIIHIVHSEDLFISFKEKNPDESNYFPSAEDTEFGHNTKWYNVRVESVVVNGGWTKYTSLNNKCLDLIAYFNTEFGEISMKKLMNLGE